jgi:hypothetical protein
MQHVQEVDGKGAQITKVTESFHGHCAVGKPRALMMDASNVEMRTSNIHAPTTMSLATVNP